MKTALITLLAAATLAAMGFDMSAAAVGFGQHQAEQAGFRHQFGHVPGEGFLVRAGQRVLGQVRLGETAHGFLEGALFLGEVEVHQRARGGGAVIPDPS